MNRRLMKAGEKNYLRNQMAQRPTVTQMSRKFESHAFTDFFKELR